MQWLIRILFVLSMAFFGLVAGTYVGGRYFVPPGSGLAAGAMALGYGLLGALLAAVPALFVAVKLSGKRLTRVALATVAGAVLMLAALVWSMRRMQRERLDPESAYQGLPAFSLSLRQMVIVDPYLSTATEVDSARRRWMTTLPDGRNCRGTLSAKAHRRIGEALLELSKMGQDAFSECHDSEEESEKLLVWELPNGGVPNAQGSLKISPDCMKNPAVARAVNAILGVGLDSKGAVKCD